MQCLCALLKVQALINALCNAQYSLLFFERYAALIIQIS